MGDTDLVYEPVIRGMYPPILLGFRCDGSAEEAIAQIKT